MTTTQQKQTIVYPRQQYEVTREWRKFLGIFSYSREVKADRINDDLHIELLNPEQFENIYLNGVKIINK
jgi:hypothetical protein